jgi:hypothetical protein
MRQEICPLICLRQRNNSISLPELGALVDRSGRPYGEAMKIYLILLFCVLFCSCKINPRAQLYERICGMVHTTNGYTVEWSNIKDKILANKDTLFLVNGCDFEILVRKTSSSQHPTDTLQIFPMISPPPPVSKGSWR